ncbi:MAG TPA: hypothetical protein VGK99_09405 [Acidobacteriota bacterium]|jgi:hypothetical protein
MKTLTAVTLQISAILITIALATMVVSLIWFTPRTVTLFLGLGLTCGIAGLVLYLAYVILDLHSRGVL